MISLFSKSYVDEVVKASINEVAESQNESLNNQQIADAISLSIYKTLTSRRYVDFIVKEVKQAIVSKRI